MDARQAKILKYVRAISRRDKIGPEDFAVQAPARPEQLDENADEGAVDTAIMEDGGGSGSSMRGVRGVRWTRPALKPRRLPTSGRRVLLPGTGDTPQTLTPEAARAYARALGGKQISQQDSAHLEAIVLPALRPAFDIVDETYDLLPGNWNIWNQKRPAISPLLRGVGRLQLTGHPSYTLVGTGFVCGPNTILTNRHVAQIFVEGIGSGATLTYTAGITCAMDMLAEVGSSASLLLDVDHPVTVSEQWDVAILHCEGLPASVTPLPLANAAPATLKGGDVTIVGYPAYDPFESLADQAAIFRAVFNRKRFQPGKMNGRATIDSFGRSVNAIAHDCSTLGGNSGSALLCADTMQVVGIHFSGVTHVSNYAVPVWELMADPAFAGLTLNYQ